MNLLALLVVAAAYVVLRRQLSLVRSGQTAALAPKATSARLQQLSSYADRLYAERKWLAAEKAYLSVLKLDHKNITAYSHLGVIYSTQKNYADAIECFQIAARLRPSGATFQNLGLAYFDNRNLVKSIAAYEKALMFEPSANRYVGLGKAQHKLANIPAAIAAYEKALELEPTPKLQQQLDDLRAEAALPTPPSSPAA
jgi:tetratricopeptide (TPR) repeat protein